MTEGGRSNGRFVKSQVLVGCDAPSVEEIFSDSFAEPFSLNNFRQVLSYDHFQYNIVQIKLSQQPTVCRVTTLS